MQNMVSSDCNFHIEFFFFLNVIQMTWLSSIYPGPLGGGGGSRRCDATNIIVDI